VPGLAVNNTFGGNQSILLTTDTPGLIVRPIAAAASDLTQWRNSGNATVTRVTSAGVLESTMALRAPGVTFPSPVTRTISVPAGAFAPGNGYFDYDNNGSRIRGNTPGQSLAFVAGLSLPQGATVTAVRLHVQDDSTSTANLTMYRQSLFTSGDFTAMAQIASGGEVIGIRTISDTTISQPVIDNTFYQYHLYLTFTTPPAPAGLDVWGVRVEYTVTGL
jgi:hypothetical protein